MPLKVDLLLNKFIAWMLSNMHSCITAVPPFGSFTDQSLTSSNMQHSWFEEALLALFYKSECLWVKMSALGVKMRQRKISAL